MLKNLKIKIFNYLFFKSRKVRKEYQEKDNYKECFTCNKVKPLSYFEVNNAKYQLPSQKKTSVNCKQCINKRL